MLELGQAVFYITPYFYDICHVNKLKQDIPEDKNGKHLVPSGIRASIGTVMHYNDFIMSMIASQTTSISTVCSTVGPGTDQRKHQSSASLTFVQGIHRWPLYSPHKRPVMQKMFPFDDVIMEVYIHMYGINLGWVQRDRSNQPVSYPLLRYLSHITHHCESCTYIW